MGIYQRHFHTIRLQHGSESHIHTQLIGCIIEASLDIGTMLPHLTIYQCPEHILRIMTVVLNTGRIADGISLRMDQGTDGIQLHTTRYQGVDVHISFESRHRRSIQLHLHRLEMVAHIFDESGNEVILTCRKVDMSARETVANHHLIDATVLELLP